MMDVGDIMELTNCLSCGEVFAKNVVDVCPKCYRVEEEAFQKVYRFLQKKKNRSATLPEIAEETKVEEELIIKFLKQNRLRASELPQLMYPCESCGKLISEQRYCKECTSEFFSEWGEAKKQVERSEEHTSELQSRFDLVCRLLLDKKNKSKRE